MPLEAISRYLDTPAPGYALLLSGPWGVGKSFGWSRYCESPHAANRDLLKISAAGLEKFDELQSAVFQASVKSIGPQALRSATTVVSRALLRTINVDPDDIVLRADFASERTVVCVDDVERFAGDFAVLLGFVAGVIDGAVHCVLIAEESEAQRRFPTYGAVKERIVGKTIVVEPDVPAFVDQVVRGHRDQRVRQQLESVAPFILEIIKKAGVSNLRTVKYFLVELGSVLEGCIEEIGEGSDLKPLVSAIGFWCFAERKSHETRTLIAKIFRSSSFGIELSMSRIAAQKGDAKDPDPIHEMIFDLGFGDHSYTWPKSDAMVDLILRGKTNPHDLAVDFKIAPPPITEPPLSARLTGHAILSDVQIQELVAEALKALRLGSFTSAQETYDVFRSLYWMSEKLLTESSPNELTELFIDNIHLSTSNWNDDASLSVMFWHGDLDDNENLVAEKINSATEVVAEERLNARKLDFIESLITGAGDMPEAVSGEGPLFLETDPRIFFDRLRAGGVASIIRVARFFAQRNRVSNAGQYVAGDRSFAMALGTIISIEASASRPIPIIDAELKQLSRQLDLFVSNLDRYAGTRTGNTHPKVTPSSDEEN